MIFLIVLLAALAIAWLLPSHGRRRSVRDAARVAMALAFVFAGASHFVTPAPFVQHLPTWVPERHAVIYLSGLVEVALGLALLRATRWRAEVAVLIALYLLAVFPANVYVAVRDVAVDGQPGGWYPWVRLPFQALFIGWVLWSAGAFPVRRGAASSGMTPVQVGR
jgi:uncharacterized membrane protein